MTTAKMRTIISRKFDPRRGRFVNHAVESDVYKKSTVDSQPDDTNRWEIDMENGTYTIGRKDRRSGPRRGPEARRERRGNLVWVNHDTVSNVHAELDVLNGQVYLKDLNSTNGTYIDEQGQKVRFKEGYVTPDQVIYLGDYRCTVESLLKAA